MQSFLGSNVPELPSVFAAKPEGLFAPADSIDTMTQYLELFNKLRKLQIPGSNVRWDCTEIFCFMFSWTLPLYRSCGSAGCGCLLWETAPYLFPNLSTFLTNEYFVLRGLKKICMWMMLLSVQYTLDILAEELQTLRPCLHHGCGWVIDCFVLIRFPVAGSGWCLIG